MAIAEYKKSCDLKELDLESYKRAYEECRDTKCEIPFWKDSAIAGFAGFLLGATMVYFLGGVK